MTKKRLNQIKAWRKLLVPMSSAEVFLGECLEEMGRLNKELAALKRHLAKAGLTPLKLATTVAERRRK